jgi:hypothetical protein
VRAQLFVNRDTLAVQEASSVIKVAGRMSVRGSVLVILCSSNEINRNASSDFEAEARQFWAGRWPLSADIR